MKLGISKICFLLILVFSGSVLAQGSEIGTPSSGQEHKQEKSAVTAVYGVTADDYLPEHTVDDYVNPKTRRAASRPSFDLPDAFYFIGGPVFLLILLRVLVIFLNGFEEKRKEEDNQVASEHFNPD